MHFLVKLERAAPESFFSVADASHVALESLSHFVTKLFSAAPASFFSAACDLHVAVCAAAGRIPSIKMVQTVTARIGRLPWIRCGAAEPTCFKAPGKTRANRDRS